MITKLKNSTLKIEDENGFWMEPNGIYTNFNFEYEQFLREKALAESIGNVNKVSEKDYLRIAIMFLMLNPVVFDFTVNVLQKFIIFKVLDLEEPLVL